MKVIWSRTAEHDRSQIIKHIGQEDVLAAVRMDALFAKAALRLASHPHLGKPGAVSGTFELIVHKSYRLVYEIHNSEISILTLMHTARLWPR